MWEIKVYYQDFQLNSGTFNNDNLILNEADSSLITAFSYPKLKARFKKFGINFYPALPSKIEVCEALFKAFNLHPMEFASFTHHFKEIGHTSMSVGDYVVIYDDNSPDDGDKVFICGSAAWKEIDNLEQFDKERNKVIEQIFNLPVEVIRSMSAAPDTDFKAILNTFKDTKCESLCPKCNSEDIDWGSKDIQDESIYQNGTCRECGHGFTEIYEYVRTESDETVEEDKENA